jgi:hypothetical protein
MSTLWTEKLDEKGEEMKKETVKKYLNRDDVIDLLPLFSKERAKVMKLPIADVVEMRHGEWREEVEYYDDEYSECNTRIVFACSLCGRTEKSKQPYCNCGAKMDGDKASLPLGIQRSGEEVGSALKTLHNEMFENDNSRCYKCARELYCSVRRDYDRSCPNYIRDPKDGGFYG